MKTYSVLYAEDVPHYATVDIEASTDEEAIEKAKSHDFDGSAFDPDWNNTFCARIVHIEDQHGKAVASGISLDSSILLASSEARDAIQYALEVLGGFKADWLANHGLNVVIEKLQTAYAEIGGAA